ncbi:HNH endonuclease [Moritella sp. 5]|uniref:HNH endonuclease n=1 Tax=Moritella sp. 5 TaxID=2746231 RepID=UPI001BA4E499|nr:HNH endonuclease [Moritella sp. 5]QUM81403.1 HNH endonuclease [Moritella sp. 5]
MKLSVNFSGLENAVKTMGASKRTDFKLDLELTGIDPIDVGLELGISVELKDVIISSGLLSYKGRQVLVYIEDHGAGVGGVISGSSSGNKYHISDCSTLQGMRRQGRYDRYVVTNNITGEFKVSGYNYHNSASVEGLAKLSVCKNCLTKLNYRNYTNFTEKNKVFSEFSMESFFSTYSSYFPHMPTTKSGERDNAYTDDWTTVSAKYKYSKEYNCESCDVHLRNHKHLLHTHHINGVKSENRLTNLKALCIDCHSKQAKHGHMNVSHGDRKLITRLRHEQNKDNAVSWDDIFQLADPAMHGFLYACKQNHGPLPEVGYMLVNEGIPVAELEIAWPKANIGFVIAEEDKFQATECGWDIRSSQEGLDDIRSLVHYLGRNK